MTTVQESLASSVFPVPCSAENAAVQDCDHLPKNKADNNHIAATAYHVPPERYAPKPDFRRQELPSVDIDTNPLPERCQFMFSDGRQCSMGRSEIHPSLCRFHAEREDQLFGDPTGGDKVVGAALDLPELYSACRDLTTAAGVSRALAQVFRLLAQRRISRQEAATFGHLAQLLLRTISLMRSESGASENTQPMIALVERQKGVPITPLLPQEKDVPVVGPPSHTNPPAKPGPSFRATIWSEESLSHAPTSEQSRRQLTPASCDVPAALNSLQINTSASAVCNSPEINTYEIAEFKPVQNQHLYKESREAPVPQLSARASDRQSSGA